MSYHCALKARRNFPLTISYSFCCSKSLVAIISLPNTGAPKGQHTEGSKHREVMIPATQVSDRILYHTAAVLCHTDISYRTDTSYNTDISCLVIIYSHYNNTPSWHHIPSCRYHVMLIYCVVSYHTIRIFPLLIQYHTYIEATAIICVTKINSL